MWIESRDNVKCYKVKINNVKWENVEYENSIRNYKLQRKERYMKK